MVQIGGHEPWLWLKRLLRLVDRDFNPNIPYGRCWCGRRTNVFRGNWKCWWHRL